MEKGIATITINDEPPKPTTFEDLGYVQVIRCKDCKWSKPEKVFKNVPTSKDMVRWCELITRYVDDDWFCADGERK